MQQYIFFIKAVFIILIVYIFFVIIAHFAFLLHIRIAGVVMKILLFQMINKLFMDNSY